MVRFSSPLGGIGPLPFPESAGLKVVKAYNLGVLVRLGKGCWNIEGLFDVSPSFHTYTITPQKNHTLAIQPVQPKKKKFAAETNRLVYAEKLHARNEALADKKKHKPKNLQPLYTVGKNV